jgi:hypothetical protein
MAPTSNPSRDPVWEQLARDAAEWLVAWISSPPLPAVTLFLIGHTIELYLKAAYAAKSEAGKTREQLVCELKGYKHNLWRLWATLKRDCKFMPAHRLRQDLYRKSCADVSFAASRSDKERDHLSEYNELYVVFEHLPDLKYMFLPPWEPPVLTFSLPGHFWLNFIQELRAYMEYPRPGVVDHLVPLMKKLQEHQSAYVHLQSLVMTATPQPTSQMTGAPPAAEKDKR